MMLLFLFAVCQKEQDHLTMSYLGRIGVSLMLRYHKTHQWGKVTKHVCNFTRLGCQPATNLLKSPLCVHVGL